MANKADDTILVNQELNEEAENELEIGDDNKDLLENESLDKVEEYFRLKDVTRTFRKDLADLKVQNPSFEQLDKLQKEVKKVREDIKEDESIRNISDKIATAKERMDLLKELIRIELLETAKEEVKRNGRKLKLVNVLKEMKDEEDKKSKGSPKFKPNSGNSIFRN